MTEEQYVGFKPSYIAIFSINYLFQGVVQSLFAVIIPIYLLFLLGGISPSEIAFLGSIILIPFSTKLLYGILTDKFGSKKFGRRKPWIIGPAILAGTMWIIVSALITPSNAISLLVIAGLFIYTGVAMSDTALDGLILDITPKAQLGRAQGFCWSSRSVGVIGGGPILALLLVTVDIITVELIFMIMGILMITTSLFTHN